MLEGTTKIDRLVVVRGTLTGGSGQAFLKGWNKRGGASQVPDDSGSCPGLRSEGVVFETQPVSRLRWRTVPEHPVHSRFIFSIQGERKRSHQHLSGHYSAFFLSEHWLKAPPPGLRRTLQGGSR